MPWRYFDGTYGGIRRIPPTKIPPNGVKMALTDTFVKQVKPTANAAGGKYRDGEGM